ncbi:phosphoglycerate mutase [Metschnikowia bicuspidata var. bicuspidata NRRL YB-4993]|uniref:Phosphoglycerate mutase n=1 Tax=Metschnikowia bicuspidata var. bicuspidata NRRL YB-4993 TaxID=869754 RepID=A0A1A0HDF0_9ASCO|nr:phosphoglycerate mutase [Metschnikowia bicuspidata var. bicuspidata NRRL YB-4993]OBA21922.1 phosphoglycerate mutase [Metschnikowia bicuspidata var. bicuspidata NRRL YB-4993]
MPHKLIVLRHGESQWNHENRFCGWIDIPLSEKGRREAHHAGQLLTAHGIKPSFMFTSMLQRSIQTGQIILETVGRMWVPHEKSWRLNERHYGAFQGRSKSEVYRQYGKARYQYYRRDFHAVPPKADARHDASIDERYEGLLDRTAPSGESLETTLQRLLPYVESDIVSRRVLGHHDTVLVVTHGLIVRSLIKHFCHVSDERISEINVPTGVPLVFELDDRGRLLGDYYYLDEELARRGMEKVAREGQVQERAKC